MWNDISPSPLKWPGKGIGTYDDTPGSPPIVQQLDLARDLVGSGHTILFLSGLLGPSPPTRKALKEKLEAAYRRSLRVIVRLGWSGSTRQRADAGTNFTRYVGMAQALADIVAALPLPPPHLQPLLVHAGNELNACNEWRCNGPYGRVLSIADRVAEIGGFMSDTMQAFGKMMSVRNGSIWLAHASLASWNHEGCECGTNTAVGIGRPGTDFLRALLDEHPRLYRDARWLSSHSYPYSNANYSTDPASKSFRGLTYYRAELGLIRSPLPVVITETGWARNGLGNRVSADDQAAWLRLAAEQIWMRDTSVRAVCPFLLGGRFWETKGWNFVVCPSNTSDCNGELRKLPVYQQWQETGLRAQKY